MKNDKEKLEKLFNLLKDGMDMLTNDGNGLHIGVSAIIKNGDDSYFSIKDVNDERNNRIYSEGTPNEVIDKTLRTFYSLGRDGKNLENLDFGEDFKEYKEAGKELWGYPVLEQQYLIEKATPLEVIKDINFETGLENFALSIDSLRTRDFDNSRWNIFAKEGNYILNENDINKIGIDNVAKLFTDKESALEVIKEFGRELKPIENLEVLENREQNSFYDPAKSYNGGGYHQPYQKLTFDVEGQNYTLIYDNTSCGDFGKRYEIDLFITESKKPVYHFEFNNMDKVEDDELDEYLKVYKEVLTEDLWNSLIYNEEINNYFEKDKTYHELIEEPEFGAPVYLLPMFNNTEDYYSDIIENNLFHFKKVYEKVSDFPISALLINNEEFDDDTSKENFIGALKDNNEVVLVKIEDFKDGILLVNLALEEDINFNKPFLEFQTENNQIKDIRYFENIREVTENTINVLNFFNKNEFKDLPEVLELGKTNAEFLLGRDFLNDLKDELGINNIADNVLVRALFETQKRLQGTPDPSYGDYDNEFYDKKTFLQVFDEQFETQIENLDFPDKVDILKKNATELGLHISKGEVVEFYDENWEEYDLDEINDFIVEKITPIVKEKLETVIENDNEKEGMIFKPVIDEFKDNTRNEFIDFDNVISKFRTVLERDLKNNKEKEEEFEK